MVKWSANGSRYKGTRDISMSRKLNMPRGCTAATVLLLTLVVGGCTWVKKTPQADNVRVAPIDRVADCTSLGSVTTSTVDNISIVNRNTSKVAKELETLAQNEAGGAGADTIVATTAIIDGRRTFALYKCLK